MPDSIFSNLRAGHPRLFLTDEDLVRLRGVAHDDPLGRTYVELLRRQGEEILTLPPVERVFVGWDPNYMYMLLESRKVVHRVYTLGMLFRLTGEERWAARAVKEMLAVARFVDWHPAHWLDVAEMMNAVATGYDWLYHFMTPEQRAEISVALLEKGLREAERAYWNPRPEPRHDTVNQRMWWARNPFNWNNVCNGGVIVGALALAEEYPELAERLIREAVVGLPFALASYAPDGAWAEGPGYWRYATTYTALAFSALETALGTDFGLSDLPGMAEAGWFRMHGAGPAGLVFNFADAAETSSFEPALYYLARRYRNPAFARAAEVSRKIGDADVTWGAFTRALLWYDPQLFRQLELEQPDVKPARDAHYANTHLAFFRSAWDDPDAFYVGFKGGDNQANHSHLDLGTFVFDALGQRWVSDLCGDEYTLAGYWETHGRRWSYYRLGTAGHNTLLLDGKNQKYEAKAPLTAFSSSPDSAYAVADLTAAYAPSGALRVQRRIELGGGRRILTTSDEVQTSAPVTVEWRIHTTATVEVQGATAVLRRGGKTMLARLLQPAGAVFQAEQALTEPPQNPLLGMTRLMVRLSPATEATIVVRFEPA